MVDRYNIAVERMEKLFRLARETYEEDPELSHRYTDLIKRISQRTRTKIPQNIKRNICKKCGTIQIQGINSHTRIRSKREPHVVQTCHLCGYVRRIHLKDTTIRNRI